MSSQPNKQYVTSLLVCHHLQQNIITSIVSDLYDNIVILQLPLYLCGPL